MSGRDDAGVADPAGGRPAIQGLKLRMTGVQIRQALADRIAHHERCVEHWKRELARTAEDQTDDAPLLPDEMCENEAERHEWRLEVLELIRDHLDPDRTYWLGEADLAFGELLPEKPAWLEQSEFDERNGGRFELRRLVRAVRGLTGPMPWSPAAATVGDTVDEP